MEITVYTFKDSSFRVVAGEHVITSGATVHQYPHAQLAYAVEASPAIKAAILRIDPTADQGGTLGPVRKVRIPCGLSSTTRVQLDADIPYEVEGDFHGRLTYRGYTLVQLTLGSWVVAALTGIPFLTRSDAQRAVDRHIDRIGSTLPRTIPPHGDSL